MQLTGIDLGKEMVRLAAKRGDATYFVANMKDIPVADGAFDMVTELFAPFNEREFARVLAPEGSLYTVVPGARHLFGLKEVLYDTPYLNDEKLPQTTELELVGTQRVSANITLQTQADIEAVFQMTPYYYRTRPAKSAWQTWTRFKPISTSSSPSTATANNLPKKDRFILVGFI